MKINQKYRLKKDSKNNVDLRIIDIQDNIISLERCEHHEGLTHESFDLFKEHLLQEYYLIK